MTEQACRTFDEVYFAIAYNPAKKGMFDGGTRLSLAQDVLRDALPEWQYKKLTFLLVEKEFTVSVARQHGVTTIMRGIRNANDFAYEKDIQGFNNDIEIAVDHVYVIPPEDITRISSSAVRGFVGINNWEVKVAKYVHPIVLEALKTKA